MWKQTIYAGAIALGALTAGLGSAQAQEYEHIVEPREHAFALDVPGGWQVRGGLLRRASNVSNLVMYLASPDGQSIQIGDPNITPFVIPGPGLPPTGSQYRVADSINVVQPYYRGVQFARQWGGSVLNHLCNGQVRLAEADDVQPPAPDVPYMGQSTAGVAIFACGDQIAYVFAVTKLNPPASWEVTYFLMAMAPADSIASTVGVLYHMLGSVEVNQRWLMNEIVKGGISRQSAEQMVDARMRQQVQIQHYTSNEAQAAQDDISRMLEGDEISRKGHVLPVGPNGPYHWTCGGRHTTSQSEMVPGRDCTEQ